MYITEQSELEAFCKRAQAAKILCLDTEFLREKTLFPKLCLIQLSVNAEDIVVVDPFSALDMAPLLTLFEDESVTKVAHAASQDMEAFYHTYHVIPKPLFDTQIAASFLGYRMQSSYASLVEAVCDVRLPKSESLTDWSMRPLDAEQLDYAEDDVCYLPAIYESFTTDLMRKDRLSWVLPEMEPLVDPSHYEYDPAHAYLHLRKVNSLTKRQLGVAAELCAWREQRAITRNIPRRWVLSDELTLELCRRMPRNGDRLRRIRGTQKLSDADCTAIIGAVERGTKRSDVSFPKGPYRPHLKGDSEGVVDLMNALLRIRAEREQIAPQLVATHDDLIDLLLGSKGCRLLTGWRYDVAGKDLQRLLDGELGLTVKNMCIQIL